MKESSKGNNRYIAKLGFTLFIITSITALLLAGVNAMTAEPIKQLKIEARNQAMQLVMPESSVLEDRTVVGDASTVYTVALPDGTNGYCVEVAPSGFGGPISMIVGIEINNDGETPVKRITGVAVVSMTETAGLGTKAKDESFISQFTGKTAGTEPSGISVGKGDDDIDAISGATITSKAVTAGVNMALDAIRLDAIKASATGEGGTK